MIVVVQRVTSAQVRVKDESVARIGRGMVVLVGVEKSDSEAIARATADKVASLRIFEDPHGKMNLGLDQVQGSVLAVSQFTLAGDIRKGRRPSFDGALRGDAAEGLFDSFVERLRSLGVPTETGVFGARMEVSLANDGPVTFVYRKNTEGVQRST